MNRYSQGRRSLWAAAGAVTNSIKRRRDQLRAAGVTRQVPAEALEARILMARDLYVDIASAGPAHDGSSWGSAYVDLQLALAAASAGDRILVADGTYKPTATMSRTISFALKDGVSILGGYAGYGAADPDARDSGLYVTVLSGDIGTVGDNTDNSYHVVAGKSGITAAAVLDGLTITAGNANGSTDNGFGGGVWNPSSSSPTLINCTVAANSATWGGGMYNKYTSSPTLIGCTFRGNWASQWGGAIHNAQSSSPKVTNTLFVGNAAGNFGGAIYNDYSSSPTLTNCTISGNSASNGGAISNSSAGVTLANSIVWGNGSTPIYNTSSTTVITYSDVQDGYAGTGNINADPLFVRTPWTGPDGLSGTADDDFGDLRLRSGSPALNVGSNAAVPAGVSTDLSGSARVQDGTVDLGTYEGASAAAAPRTLYVDAAAVGAGTGSSWADAFANLQSALAAAADGDTICVADGTYRPTSTANRQLSFSLRNGVALYGGYAGLGAADPDARDVALYPTILSGDIGTAGNQSDNSYHVVVASNVRGSTTLDGFTITAGNANGSSVNGNGGGIYIYASSLGVANCTFNLNSATGYGGGMSNWYSSLTLTNSRFGANSSGTSGGGVYNRNSSLTVTNSTFAGNSAGSNGGGMLNDTSSATLINCTFSGNLAYSGGGMYNGSSSPTLTNCILWGNSSSIYNGSGSAPVVTYSDVQGGYSGTGNLNADPLFVRALWTGPDGLVGTADDDYGDLRLRAGSPVLNVGSNAAVPAGVSTDLAGNARIQNGTVDLGAYEGPSAAAAPKTIYVDLAAGGANSGSSWADAFTSLQSALLAAVDGDTIRVADGTYRPTAAADRQLTFALRNAVALYGGYAGYGAADPDARDVALYTTILSGDIGAAGNQSDNSYHVVAASNTVGGAARLDGFTITAGNANGSGRNGEGGGLYSYYASLALANCTFSANSASGSGGGLDSFYCSLILTDVTFSGNSAGTGGGGMYSYYAVSLSLTNATFSENSASYGGGLDNYSPSSSPTLTNCTFIRNLANTYGGGMYNGSPLTLSNGMFLGNVAGTSGGGIYDDNYPVPARIINTVLVGNRASSGGGMYNDGGVPALTNTTFAGNAAGTSGGAMLNAYLAAPTLTNCILWGNGTSPIRNNNSSTPVFSYSDIEGGYTGTKNINADPKFVRNPSPGLDGTWGTEDDDYGDLRLQSSSPSIDAGNNGASGLAGITTDLAGRSRFVDVPTRADTGSGTAPIVDMGAYEFARDITLSSAAIAENLPPGTAVGAFATSDTNAGDTLTYSLVSGTGSSDNASFAISGSTLLTTASFDYEARSSYSIRVRSTDQGGLWFEKVLTIGVTDGDEIAPSVSSVAINDGAAQRSMVKKLSVVFSEAVVLSTGALQVKLSDGALPPNTSVTVSNPSGDQKSYVVSFSGSAVMGGSLADGIYDLIVSATGVQDLAGNVLTADYSQRFHRLFGDSDGNRVVNALDYARLKNALGRSPSDPLFNRAFDYEANGLINALDLARFRQRYGMSFSY